MAFVLLGCPHKHLSFPIVTGEDRARHGEAAQPHVTCLECGREFWYDWNRMRRTTERPLAVYVRHPRADETPAAA